MVVVVLTLLVFALALVVILQWLEINKLQLKDDELLVKIAELRGLVGESQQDKHAFREVVLLRLARLEGTLPVERRS